MTEFHAYMSVIYLNVNKANCGHVNVELVITDYKIKLKDMMLDKQ